MTLQDLGIGISILAGVVTLLLKGPQLCAKVKDYWIKQQKQRQELRQVSEQLHEVVENTIRNYPRFWYDLASKSSAKEIYDLAKSFYVFNLHAIFLYCQHHKILCPTNFPKNYAEYELDGYYRIIFQWQKFMFQMQPFFKREQHWQMRQKAKKLMSILIEHDPENQLSLPINLPICTQQDQDIIKCKFQNGDTVCHKGSPEPIMTVEDYRLNPRNKAILVECKWYDKEKREFKFEDFNEDSLENTSSISERRAQVSEQLRNYRDQIR